MPTPVKLPPAFTFSQSSLQDFADCARRFQLRYVMQQQWPAPPAEPLHDVERADQLGKQFHLVMQRHWLGMPVDREKLDPALQPWWDAFLNNPPATLPGTIRRPEVNSSAVIGGRRLVATFDLLAYEPGGQATIVDWKTSQRKPAREWLDRRLQTLVYPLLLVDSSKRLLGYALAPENVRLIYWFANAPAEVEIFQYSPERCERDRQTLSALFERLFTMDMDSEWSLTSNTRLCAFCQYRSLCDRGREAGDFGEEYEEDGATGVVIESSESDEFVL